jgi:CRISPR-associated protein Cmr1
MSRRIDRCPDAPSVPVDQAANLDGHYPGLLLWQAAIRAITPVFGGGTTPGENDPVTMVRPSSIRGHLRFWWRAMQGAQFGKVEDLRKREGAIWGTTEIPSQILVEVQDLKAGRPEAYATFPSDRTFPKFTTGYPAYALFPFQGNKKDGIAPALARRDAEFRLTVRYPAEFRYEVFAALWAWTNFGGIGARTRRGCGALVCDFFAPKSAATLPQWWAAAKSLMRAPPAGTEPAWPRVVKAPLVSPNTLAPHAAWEAAVGLMREFRQGENVGRNRGSAPNRPGRSRWPEADSLRQITSAGDPRHQPSITASQPAFPRAELGLPIVFHFKDYQDAANNSELYPKLEQESRRMASPVILRPLGIAGGTQAGTGVYCSRPAHARSLVWFGDALRREPGSSEFHRTGPIDLSFGDRTGVVAQCGECDSRGVAAR